MNKIPAISSGKIKLSAEERKLFNNLAKTNNRTEMLNVFIPHMQKRAEFVAEQEGISSADYFQELCLKFLEYIDKVVKTTQPTHNMTLLLNKRKITPDDFISNADESIEEIDSDKAFYDFSCNTDKKTPLEITEAIIDTAKPHIKEKKIKAMTMFIDGMNFEEIGKQLDLSMKRVEKIYYEFIHKMQNLNKQGLFNNIVLEYTPEPPLAVADSQSEKSKASDVVQEKFEAEITWNEAKRKYAHWDTFKELDSMMKTQTTSKELMLNKSSQAKLKKKLEQDPDFKFRLELNRRCDNPKFKEEAEQISINLFGKNIFEFV